MKNLMAIIMGISLFFAVSGVYAQKNKSQIETSEVKANIESLILDVEKKVDNPLKLNRAIKKVNDQLLGYWNSNIFVSNETKRDVTIRLINIFNKITDFEMNNASKIWIIETIGINDNSSEAHKFFLSLLKSENKKHRDHALWSLNPTGVHGNDIYDEIKNLENKKILSKLNSLMYLKSASLQRALPEIQNFLRTTKNINDFVVAGVNLCLFYKNPEVIDVLIDRYNEFNAIKAKTKKEYVNYEAPHGAIPTKLLLKYIQIKEGKRFKIALEILNKKGTTDEEEFPLILPKLKSKDIVTREAVISFLENQVTRMGVKEGIVIPILEEAEKNEKDKELKNKINKKINNLKKRKQIKWKRN